MKACLSFSDILEVGQPQIQEMQRIGDAYPAADVPGACVALTRQVRIVEGIVVQTYGVAASLARKAEDLNEIAEIWSRMSFFCRSALNTLSSLKHKYPYCGTPELYDMVLDYKLACEKRYKGVMEELACQSTSFPKGLLPEMK
ncbi:MAG: hypothetical protein HY735_21430 [Verrucomicrobia bacterium]|nr:hypothetical protein [Verrucomicrobiota bacterium]